MSLCSRFQPQGQCLGGLYFRAGAPHLGLWGWTKAPLKFYRHLWLILLTCSASLDRQIHMGPHPPVQVMAPSSSHTLGTGEPFLISSEPPASAGFKFACNSPATPGSIAEIRALIIFPLGGCCLLLKGLSPGLVHIQPAVERPLYIADLIVPSYP